MEDDEVAGMMCLRHFVASSAIFFSLIQALHRATVRSNWKEGKSRGWLYTVEKQTRREMDTRTYEDGQKLEGGTQSL